VSRKRGALHREARAADVPAGFPMCAITGDKMARPRRIGDDDDDEVPRRGRPRGPEEFGPPKPDPHQRNEYAKRLQSLLDALDIPELGLDERMYLQRILWRADRLHSFDPARFPARGANHVVFLLRSIAETTNGVAALKLPILMAVSACLDDAWTSQGLQFLEAMDQVPLLEMQAALRSFGLEEHLDRAVRWKLTEILGPPIVPQQPTKPAPRMMKKPPTVSRATWDEVMAMRKDDRGRREKSRRAARMPA
jgi:hypothetical protein